MKEAPTVASRGVSWDLDCLVPDWALLERPSAMIGLLAGRSAIKE